MARLNEPAMSAETLETQRRKFLRQNREIVRINTNQSQRIRELENDCARMLSENLELRSHVLRLERDIELNSSQRIADHALEVKARLEAQLSIFNTILEGLGSEPPRKRRSPETRKLAKPKSSPGLASPARRLRNVARDAEAAAMQEGRLPAIPENRSFPREARATLNTTEIQALNAEATDTTDSPDLGPPPVSRFVEDALVKIDLPCKKPVVPESRSMVREGSTKEETRTPVPKPELGVNVVNNRTTKERNEPSVPRRLEKSSTSVPSSSTPATAAASVGSKRKYGDENDLLKILKDTEKKSSGDDAREKPQLLKELQTRRSIKDLPASKREPRDRPTAIDNHRKALSAKSTNDDLSSPRKVGAKPLLNDDLKQHKQPASQGNRRQERAKPKNLPTVEIPPPQLPTCSQSPVTCIAEPETPIPDTPLTPGHSVPRDNMPRDTPPPADINSLGEATRPSRRARPAISYAEPNLRDKMRRPTKELFDAVAGEGKFIQRASIAPTGKEENGASAGHSTSKSKVDAATAEAKQEAMSAADYAAAKEAARRESVLSPLAQKDGSMEGFLPSTIDTRRKRRGSSMGPRESLAAQGAASMESLLSRTSSSASLNFSEKPAPEIRDEDIQSADVYDFNSSSPAPEEKEPELTVVSGSKPISGHLQGRKPRAAVPSQENGALDSIREIKAASAKCGSGSRKRASMAPPKTKAALFENEDADESSGELDGPPVVKDRMSRRRSMML